MASARVFVVFVLPVIFSIIIGTAVLSGVLQNPDRELNMWPMSFSDGLSSNTPIQIIGLSKQYSTSVPVEIQVKIGDSSFRCGDLYITIYSAGKSDVITQGGFFEQCFEENNVLPIGDSFSKVIETPGSYEIVTEMVSKDLKNISTRGTFTVK
ncbi:hypothetical protein BD31_I1802 [Candidatus Nitrosopumilus salaria BD31]|jgi:hypothetical protein|uniref:Uncharacterized protein n=1 Tax=Candidatus Nitrosopumilus salarius BD31 TaxID=859350 RepID=I3D0P5_9ARCH|nr:hypothetical protein [Candidatus Nitrosopumilus salaria]EIJ65288.1 hypothetical protein BD31_I1802 [Candidatus Nitrosopumilus salaria BD31]